MACKCEHNNGETAESRDSAGPMDNAYWASVRKSVPFDEVVKDQYNQITHGSQGRDAGIFEGIEASKVGQRNYD